MAILMVPLIGCIYKKAVPTRYRTRFNKDLKTRSTLSKNLGTQVYTMESNPPIVGSNEPDLDFPEWLCDDIVNMYNFDTRTDNSAIPTFPTEEPQLILSPSPDPMPNFPEDMAGIGITYVSDFPYTTEPGQYFTLPTEFPSYLELTYPTEVTEYSQLINNLTLYGPAIVFGQSEDLLNGTDSETLPPPYIAYDTTSEPDWSFINFSDSYEQGSYNIEVPYGGPDPGSLSTPSSGTEDLETPTTTPAYSPVSVASSPQQQLSSRNLKYTCKYESCGYKGFSRFCDLNKHLKIHNKNLLCDFEPNGNCRERFSTEKDRKRHKDTKHENKRPYTCHICLRAGTDRKFSRIDNFRVHKRKLHGEM